MMEDGYFDEDDNDEDDDDNEDNDNEDHDAAVDINLQDSQLRNVEELRKLSNNNGGAPMMTLKELDQEERKSQQQTMCESRVTYTTFNRRPEGHYLGTKAEMVYSLLSILGTHDLDGMSRTLLNMSTSSDSCSAMRQSGCVPLLVHLIHGSDDEGSSVSTRACAAAALYNIVHAHRPDHDGRQELRVLKLLEQIRAYCELLREETASTAIKLAPLNLHENGINAGQAVSALMKLTFDEEHRRAVCTLGGVEAIGELLRLNQEAIGVACDSQNVTMRRYACMALTNLTFGDGANKSAVCARPLVLASLSSQLQSTDDDLCQVAASVLRNLSWHADAVSKKNLRNVGCVMALTRAMLTSKKESTLKSVLSALWNFSSHSSENKADICSVDGCLQFLVRLLTYVGPSQTLSIIENGGGILRNISSHISTRPDYRAVLRQNGCLSALLKHLRSPSLTIVSNACGTLWNLSARCEEDQKALWDLGAIPMLRNLVHSRHRLISMGSAAALKNLLSSPVGAGRSIDSALTLGGGDGRHGGYQHATPTIGLHARRRRALVEELNEHDNLAETCENLESPITSPNMSPTPCDSQPTAAAAAISMRLSTSFLPTLRSQSFDRIRSMCRSEGNGTTSEYLPVTGAHGVDKQFAASAGNKTYSTTDAEFERGRHVQGLVTTRTFQGRSASADYRTSGGRLAAGYGSTNDRDKGDGVITDDVIEDGVDINENPNTDMNKECETILCHSSGWLKNKPVSQKTSKIKAEDEDDCISRTIAYHSADDEEGAYVNLRKGGTECWQALGPLSPIERQLKTAGERLFLNIDDDRRISIASSTDYDFEDEKEERENPSSEKTGDENSSVDAIARNYRDLNRELTPELSDNDTETCEPNLSRLSFESRSTCVENASSTKQSHAEEQRHMDCKEYGTYSGGFVDIQHDFEESCRIYRRRSENCEPKTFSDYAELCFDDTEFPIINDALTFDCREMSVGDAMNDVKLKQSSTFSRVSDILGKTETCGESITNKPWMKPLKVSRSDGQLKVHQMMTSDNFVQSAAPVSRRRFSTNSARCQLLHPEIVDRVQQEKLRNFMNRDVDHIANTRVPLPPSSNLSFYQTNGTKFVETNWPVSLEQVCCDENLERDTCIPVVNKKQNACISDGAILYSDESDGVNEDDVMPVPHELYEQGSRSLDMYMEISGDNKNLLNLIHIREDVNVLSSNSLSEHDDNMSYNDAIGKIQDREIVGKLEIRPSSEWSSSLLSHTQNVNNLGSCNQKCAINDGCHLVEIDNVICEEQNEKVNEETMTQAKSNSLKEPPLTFSSAKYPAPMPNISSEQVLLSVEETVPFVLRQTSETSVADLMDESFPDLQLDRSSSFSDGEDVFSPQHRAKKGCGKNITLENDLSSLNPACLASNGNEVSFTTNITESVIGEEICVGAVAAHEENLDALWEDAKLVLSAIQLERSTAAESTGNSSVSDDAQLPGGEHIIALEQSDDDNNKCSDDDDNRNDDVLSISSAFNEQLQPQTDVPKVGRPRIVKPGENSGSNVGENARQSDQVSETQPKSIRGRRRALYTSAAKSSSKVVPSLANKAVPVSSGKPAISKAGSVVVAPKKTQSSERQALSNQPPSIKPQVPPKKLPSLQSRGVSTESSTKTALISVQEKSIIQNTGRSSSSSNTRRIPPNSSKLTQQAKSNLPPLQLVQTAQNSNCGSGDDTEVRPKGLVKQNTFVKELSDSNSLGPTAAEGSIMSKCCDDNAACPPAPVVTTVTVSPSHIPRRNFTSSNRITSPTPTAITSISANETSVKRTTVVSPVECTGDKMTGNTSVTANKHLRRIVSPSCRRGVSPSASFGGRATSVSTDTSLLTNSRSAGKLSPVPSVTGRIGSMTTSQSAGVGRSSAASRNALTKSSSPSGSTGSGSRLGECSGNGVVAATSNKRRPTSWGKTVNVFSSSAAGSKPSATSSASKNKNHSVSSADHAGSSADTKPTFVQPRNMNGAVNKSVKNSVSNLDASIKVIEMATKTDAAASNRRSIYSNASVDSLKQAAADGGSNKGSSNGSLGKLVRSSTYDKLSVENVNAAKPTTESVDNSSCSQDVASLDSNQSVVTSILSQDVEDIHAKHSRYSYEQSINHGRQPDDDWLITTTWQTDENDDEDDSLDNEVDVEEEELATRRQSRVSVRADGQSDANRLAVDYKNIVGLRKPVKNSGDDTGDQKDGARVSEISKNTVQQRTSNGPIHISSLLSRRAPATQSRLAQNFAPTSPVNLHGSATHGSTTGSSTSALGVAMAMLGNDDDDVTFQSLNYTQLKQFLRTIPASRSSISPDTESGNIKTANTATKSATICATGVGTYVERKKSRFNLLRRYYESTKEKQPQKKRMMTSGTVIVRSGRVTDTDGDSGAKVGETKPQKPLSPKRKVINWFRRNAVPPEHPSRKSSPAADEKDSTRRSESPAELQRISSSRLALAPRSAAIIQPFNYRRPNRQAAISSANFPAGQEKRMSLLNAVVSSSNIHKMGALEVSAKKEPGLTRAPGDPGEMPPAPAPCPITKMEMLMSRLQRRTSNISSSTAPCSSATLSVGRTVNTNEDEMSAPGRRADTKDSPVAVCSRMASNSGALSNAGTVVDDSRNKSAASAAAPFLVTAV